MNGKSKSGRFIRPTPEEDAAIIAGALSDPDTILYTDEEWEKTVERRKRARGRPPVAVPRKNITLRLSQDVVERFRASGKGWQTRIDDALKDWLKDHSPSA